MLVRSHFRPLANCICYFLCSSCRVISTAMKCFHDIKNNIKQRCRQEGADEYQLNYIRPLVEQTRPIVLAQCSLSPPIKGYYENGANSAAVSATASSPLSKRRRGWTSRTVTAVAWSTAVLLFINFVAVRPTNSSGLYASSSSPSPLSSSTDLCSRPSQSARRPKLWCAFLDCCRHLMASTGCQLLQLRPPATTMTAAALTTTLQSNAV